MEYEMSSSMHGTNFGCAHALPELKLNSTRAYKVYGVHDMMMVIILATYIIHIFNLLISRIPRNAIK